ncbi:hypothetical protein Tco_0547792 [Tanacetum coccineum]
MANNDPLTSASLSWWKHISSKEEEPSGFLSFNRVMSLDRHESPSMDVDLSKELTKTSNPIIEKQVEAAQAANIPSVKWRPAPTRREQDKWDRAAKAATGGSVCFRFTCASCFPLSPDLVKELRKPKGDPKVLAAKSREQYLKLKTKLQTLTVAIGGVGLVSSYFSYTPEITASFGAGLVGSLVYMRMLGNSMDGMAGGARGAIK